MADEWTLWRGGLASSCDASVCAARAVSRRSNSLQQGVAIAMVRDIQDLKNSKKNYYRENALLSKTRFSETKKEGLSSHGQTRMHVGIRILVVFAHVVARAVHWHVCKNQLSF